MHRSVARRPLAFVAFLVVPALLVAQKPATITGQCNDGSFTMAAQRQGACAGHGGIKVWQGRPVAEPAPPAGATAQCKDGTWSSSATRRGTCSRNGGVKTWLKELPPR